MPGKRARGLQRTTSTSHVIEMATSSSNYSSCPVPKEKARPPAVTIPAKHAPGQVVGYHIFPKDGHLDCNHQSKSPELASPRSPLSALQCLLTNYFRKVEPKTSVTVGLSIVIENYCRKDGSDYSKRGNDTASPCCKTKPQILNKFMMVATRCKESGHRKQKPATSDSEVPIVYDASVLSPLPAIDFLDACFLCKKSLGPGRDIYMYRGDRAFCSVECRCQQILTDERNDKCVSAAIKPVAASAASASASRRSGGRRNRVPVRGTATAA